MQYDGEVVESIAVDSCGVEVELYQIEGSEEGSYFVTDFEYLNTYYAVSAAIEKEEFQKIIENILIKNE